VKQRFVTVELNVREEVDAETSGQVQELLKRWGLTDAAQEAVWVITYDSARNVRSVTEVARGGYHNVQVHIPTVMSAVLLDGTDRFIIAHNHPSGEMEPTQVDIDLTKMVMDAANTVGLYFEDHVIVGPPDKYLSMTAQNLMLPAYPGHLPAVRRKVA